MHFTLLPASLPEEFKRYRTCKPQSLGRALSKGWSLVASYSFDEYIEEVGQVQRTLFLVGKDRKRQKVQGPRPVLMYPQENTGESAEDLLERLAHMNKREILALHEELLARRADDVEEAPEPSEPAAAPEDSDEDYDDDYDEDADLDDLDDDDDDDEDDEIQDQVQADMAELMADTGDDGSADDDE